MQEEIDEEVGLLYPGLIAPMMVRETVGVGLAALRLRRVRVARDGLLAGPSEGGAVRGSHGRKCTFGSPGAAVLDLLAADVRLRGYGGVPT